MRSLLEEVPIPMASVDDQRHIEFLVDELDELNDSDEQKRHEILKKIDRKVAEIYGLGKRALRLIEL